MRVRASLVVVPVALAGVIALAALSYVATRPSITPGSMFAAPGTHAAGNAFAVEWRNGTAIAIVASFTPSRAARVRSVTLAGLDAKNAFVESSESGFWDGQTPLPSFTSEADPLPSSLHPRPIRGAFSVPAHSRVFVRLVVRAVADAKVTEVLTGLRVDAESWGWARSTFIPFPQTVKLEPPR